MDEKKVMEGLKRKHSAIDTILLNQSKKGSKKILDDYFTDPNYSCYAEYRKFKSEFLIHERNRVADEIYMFEKVTTELNVRRGLHVKEYQVFRNNDIFC